MAPPPTEIPITNYQLPSTSPLRPNRRQQRHPAPARRAARLQLDYDSPPCRNHRQRFNRPQPRTPPPRPRHDPRQVRHLLHQENPQPGQRPGKHLLSDGTVLVTTGACHGNGPGRAHPRAPARGRSTSAFPYDARPHRRHQHRQKKQQHPPPPPPPPAPTPTSAAAALDATSKNPRPPRRIRRRPPLRSHPRPRPLAPITCASPTAWIFDQREAPDRRIPFKDLICKAYIERISLGERGFYITPGVDFNRDTGKGTPFLYYTNGAAVAEVLINRYTGELSSPPASISSWTPASPSPPASTAAKSSAASSRAWAGSPPKNSPYDPLGHLYQPLPNHLQNPQRLRPP